MFLRQLISIICPVYNEERAIPLFYSRLKAVLPSFQNRFDTELIFTNNQSTDASLSTILELREQDPSIHVLTLARNFGYEASVATGLRHARGVAIVVIDVDCEDPPEMIPQFVKAWEEGSDIVYGKREHRDEFFPMHLARKGFYRINRLIADSDIVLDMAEFFLISSSVRDAILASKSTAPFLRSEVAYVGFQRKGISYQRSTRVAGKTHYNLWQLMKFAIAGILSSSTFPLRLSVYLFPFLVISNIALMSFEMFQWLVTVNFIYIAFFLAVICIYLARTYKDVGQRPISVINWKQSRYD